MPTTPSPTRYDKMIYNRSGRSGLKLPAISLGLWHNFGFDKSADSMRAICRQAFDLGVTHFDFANNYGPPPGSAELAFGDILRGDFRSFRDELVISTKAGYLMWPGPYGEWGSRKSLLASLDQSLKRMGLDYVDIFYSHRLEAEGVGAIVFSPLAQGLLTDKYLDGVPTGSRATISHFFNRALLTPQNIERARHLDAIAKRRGQTLAQMALAWTLRDKRVTSALIGASSPEQVTDSVRALDNLSFTADELKEIDRHAVEGGVNLWRQSAELTA